MSNLKPLATTRNFLVGDMDLEPWAITNAGMDCFNIPSKDRLKSTLLYCRHEDAVDPNPQTMQVTFDHNVDIDIRPIDPPDRYEQMANDNNVEWLLDIEGLDYDWDDDYYSPDSYKQMLLDAEGDEFDRDNLLVRGRKLWFEIPGRRTNVTGDLCRKHPSDNRWARRPRDKGPYLPRRRDMAPAHRAFA